MTFINPSTGATLDTNAMPLALLAGMVKYLHRHSASRQWIKVNGPDSAVRFVRAVRARFFREKQPLRGRIRNAANSIDPPACRCGRPGTRIHAGTTFCLKCGPTTRQVTMRAKREHDIEAASIERREEIEAWEKAGLEHMAYVRAIPRQRKKN